jgi:hypothetical protein
MGSSSPSRNSSQRGGSFARQSKYAIHQIHGTAASALANQMRLRAYSQELIVTDLRS